MLSCCVNHGEKERNIIYGMRNIMLGRMNIYMMSLDFVYSQYRTFVNYLNCPQLLLMTNSGERSFISYLPSN